MTFAELQAAFQRAVMAGDDSVLGLIPDGAREGKEILLGVYRNAYVGRLVEVMQNDHEMVRTYLGDGAFNEMAQAYIAAHPSDQPNARWFSRHLPDFLKRTKPFSDRPHLSELALLEKTLADAFDALDAPVVTIAELAAIPPESWGDLCFATHPSAARLDFHTNAVAIWLALKEEATPPEYAPLEDEENLLVWRGESSPMFRTLGAEEAMMWDEAAKGVRFAVLCELLATYDDPENAATRAAQYLAGWLQSGAVTKASTSRLQPRRSRNKR